MARNINDVINHARRPNYVGKRHTFAAGARMLGLTGLKPYDRLRVPDAGKGVQRKHLFSNSGASQTDIDEEILRLKKAEKIRLETLEENNERARRFFEELQRTNHYLTAGATAFNKPDKGESVQSVIPSGQGDRGAIIIIAQPGAWERDVNGNLHKDEYGNTIEKIILDPLTSSIDDYAKFGHTRPPRYIGLGNFDPKELVQQALKKIHDQGDPHQILVDVSGLAPGIKEKIIGLFEQQQIWWYDEADTWEANRMRQALLNRDIAQQIQRSDPNQMLRQYGVWVIKHDDRHFFNEDGTRKVQDMDQEDLAFTEAFICGCQFTKAARMPKPSTTTRRMIDVVSEPDLMPAYYVPFGSGSYKFAGDNDYNWQDDLRPMEVKKISPQYWISGGQIPGMPVSDYPDVAALLNPIWTEQADAANKKRAPAPITQSTLDALTAALRRLPPLPGGHTPGGPRP